MQQKSQKEIEEAQKRFEESGGQKGEKTESKAGRIIRTIFLWVVMLGFAALFIMLFVKKCSGQI